MCVYLICWVWLLLIESSSINQLFEGKRNKMKRWLNLTLLCEIKGNICICELRSQIRDNVVKKKYYLLSAIASSCHLFYSHRGWLGLLIKKRTEKNDNFISRFCYFKVLYIIWPPKQSFPQTPMEFHKFCYCLKCWNPCNKA